MTLLTPIDITLYDPATGRVTGTARCCDIGLEAAYPGRAILRGAQLDARTQRVDPESGEPRGRPVVTLAVDRTRIRADGHDVATITGVPAGAVVRAPTWEGGLTVDDGEVVFATIHPGAHRLLFDLFPSRDVEVTIHAD